jgi:hypothetical protein
MGMATVAGLLFARPARAEPAAVPMPPPLAFGGVQPFIGLVAATGVTVLRSPTEDEVDLIFAAEIPTLLAALKGGLFLGRAELGVEVAPLTQLYWYIPTFEAHAFGGYHLRLSDKVSWPLRAGLGVFMGLKDPVPRLHARADLLGVSIRTDRALIDVHMPSVRFTPLPARGDRPDGSIVSWLVGVGVSWLP